MGTTSRTCSLLLGALVAATFAAVPASQAAPPSPPTYQCGTFDGPDEPDPTKILIAGDSITNASEGDYTWRYWLWQDQDGRGANVDFVGRFTDTLVAATNQRGTRAYADCGFDPDHEARAAVKLLDPGKGKPSLAQPATSVDPTLPHYPGASSWINGAVQAYTPDVLVVFAGGNDLALIGDEAGPNPTDEQIAATVLDRMRAVISEARAAKPDVDIVVTTIPTAAPRFTLYNQKLAQLVADDASPGGSKLALAQLPSWAEQSWDGLHPDAVGEAAIASAIDDALHQVDPALLPAPASRPAIALGPRFPAVTTVAPQGDNRAKVSWTYPPGADRARIWVRDVSANGAWSLAADLVTSALRAYYPDEGTVACETACTTYTLSNLSGAATYAVKVQIGKGRSIAPESAVAPEVKTVAIAGPPAVPTLNAPAAGVSVVALSWSAITGATSYDVRWRPVGNGAFSTLSAIAGTSRSVGNLLPGQSHEFQVRAVRDGAASDWSAARLATPIPPAPVVTATAGVNRVILSWPAVSGADGYALRWRAGTGTLNTQIVIGTSTTLSGLVPGVSHAIEVQAVANGTSSAWSAPKVVTPIPAAPGNTVATPAVRGAALRWNAVPGATGYSVAWRIGTRPWTLSTVAAPTYRTISGLVAGARYEVRVRSVAGSASSAWTGGVFVAPKATRIGVLGKPVLKKVAGPKVKVTWKRAAGATRYRLQFRQVGKPWRNAGWFTGVTTTSAKLAKKKAYQWRVVPYDGYVAGKVSPAARIKVK